MKALVLLVVLLKCVLILSQGQKSKIRCNFYNKFVVKTFEDEFYHFNSRCGCTLAQFTNNNDNAKVIVKFTNNVISISAGTKKYELKKNANKQPVFVGETKTHTIPARENDIEVINPGTYVTAKFTTLGLIVQWDKKESIVIDLDGDNVSNLNGICSSLPTFNVDAWSDPAGCTSLPAQTCPRTITDSSKRYCKQLLNKKQVECLRQFSQATINSFLTVCAVAHCNCKLPNKNDCICPILQVFSNACSNKLDQPVEWRKPDLCPIKCPAGQIYMECGRRQRACGEPDPKIGTEPKCIEGCVCPLNLYFYDNKCVPVTDCPCYYDGNFYKPTQSVKQDCKICTCNHNNIWNCPGPVCMEEAVVWGDPHYTTFDKKAFDFMGKCTYYLVKGIDFNIKTDHYVWQHGKFVKNFQSTLPSWIKVLHLEYNNHVVSLKPGPGVTVDGVPLKQFPYEIPGFIISKPATHKVIVQLSNLVEVHWDGYSTVKVRVPVTMRGKLAGLLGNFNKKPHDDFMLPDGTQAKNANEFGHSWVVEGSCENENTDPVPHPCKANPIQKQLAQKACAPLKTALFKNCKEYDSELSYESCVYDCCLTGAQEGEKCSCTNLAEYADMCNIQNWRKSVPACKVPCPTGQIYNYCINPCESSCDYLNLNKECNKVCIEGCSCPKGQIFNEENQCVPIEQCKCKLDGKYFPAGFSYTKEKNTLETCSKGKWSSSKLNPTDTKNHIPLTDILAKCNKMNNAGYTACKNPNPMTCLNMHNYQKKTIQNCEDGCECNDGFVLDSLANSCVKPENCPCFYNGQSYKDNAVRRDFTQKCVCTNNEWNCTPYETRIDKCSIFGDTHIRNLDGKLISFKSTCEYVLAKATLDGTTFTITTRGGDIIITFPGVTGAIITLNMKKDGSTFDELTDVADFKSSKIGMLKDIGLKFVWNREGWFHIHFDNKWRNKIEGLCARLENPNQPLTINDLKNFTDYWSVDLACFDVNYYDTTNEIFTNDDKPLQTKCELLKDKMFKPCNDEISIVDYYNKCLVTARDFLQNEDEDGAEKFYCQIFSAFAQECNDVGLPVNWRSKNQCPFTCTEKGMSYSSCVSTCTCDIINESLKKTCEDHSCTEGCVAAVCPSETVYTNKTLSECVSIAECEQIKCMKQLRKHGSNCICVNGKIECPETTTSTTTVKPTTVPPKTESQIKLLATSKNINALFEQIRNTNVLNGLSDKDKQILDTLSKYMKTIEKETLCYANLPDQSKCRCLNEGQVCDTNDSANYGQENLMKIQNKLDIIEVIESHLKCLLNVEKGCVCITGQKVCKHDDPTSRKLIYSYFVNGEKHVVKYFYYLEKAKTTLNCLSHIKKMPYGDVCTCHDSQMICSLDKPDGKKQENEEKTKLLNQYVKDVEGRLQCYARLKSDSGHCWCEGSRKICRESHTPIPADNKFEIIEHYLPTVVNMNQIEIDYTKDVECVKTLTDHKCSCVDGKKVCPDTTTTPIPPTTTKKATVDTTTTPVPVTTTKKPTVSGEDFERLSKIQIKLLNVFSNVEELLGNFQDTDIVIDLTPKELQTVNVFRDYVNGHEADINCLLILPDFGKCMCRNGIETCELGKTEKHFPLNNIQINDYLVILENIEVQLNCLITKTTENPTCVCLNGHTICPDNINAPSRTKISYDNVIANDEYRILSYYFLNYARRELKCLTTAVDLTTTTCSQGKLITTNISQNPNEVKTMNDKKISTYTAYLNTMQEQILCYSRLKHHTCRCEKGKQICTEDTNTTPQNNKFVTVEKYVQTPINIKQIYEMFKNDTLCLQNLSEDDIQCICEDGKKKCPDDQITEVEPEDNDLIDQVFTVVEDVTKRVLCLTNRKAECDNEYSMSVPSKEKLQLKVYEPYITFIKTQLTCMKNKPETCKCVKGKQICPGDVSQREELTEVELYREFLEHVNAQISCLLRVRRKAVPCFCVNGQEVCEKRSYILYPMFDRKVLTERDNDRLDSYIAAQLECFKSIEDKLIPCACKNGKKMCEQQDDAETTNAKRKIDQDIIKIDNMYPKRQCFEKTKNVECFKDEASNVVKDVELSINDFKQIDIYGKFLDYVRQQLECFKKVPTKCTCVNSKIICTERKTSTDTARHIWESRVKMYTNYIYYIRQQFECLSNLNTVSRLCSCIGGKQVCKETKFSSLIYPILAYDGGNLEYLDGDFVYIQNQIECIESIKDKAAPCVCTNGTVSCTETTDRPTDHYSELKTRIPFEIEKIHRVNSKIICLVEESDEDSCSETWALSRPSYQEIQNMVTTKDKDLLLTYRNIYIPYVLTEMECVKDSPESCVCSQGKKICDRESTTKNLRDTAANRLVLYAHFITYIDSQLNCLTTLKSNGEFCMCGADKHCDSTTKSYRLVQLISLDSPTDDDKKMMHTFVYERIRCLAYLKDRSGKCTCGKGGLEICTSLNPEVPITKIKNQSRCGVTDCPPNTRLEKKCPTCCPTCVQQFCVIILNGKTVTKQPGEKWSEGKCQQCQCLEDEDGFYASCRRKQCNFIRDADIEYKVTDQKDECCPLFTPIGCKHDGKVYNLDSMIQRSACETISCSRDGDGTVIKKIDRIICDITCPLGSEYKKAIDQCCGTCEQIGCVIGGKVKHEGSTWLAEGGCLQYSCKKSNGLFFVTKENKKC